MSSFYFTYYYPPLTFHARQFSHPLPAGNMADELKVGFALLRVVDGADVLDDVPVVLEVLLLGVLSYISFYCLRL